MLKRLQVNLYLGQLLLAAQHVRHSYLTEYLLHRMDTYLDQVGKKEPAYKLKHEFNDKGAKTLIRVSHDDKPDLKRGSQLRIIKASEEQPMKMYGHDFVQTV